MADAYFGKCAVLYKQGKLEEARVEYEKGSWIDPEMECLETEPDDLLDIVISFSKGKIKNRKIMASSGEGIENNKIKTTQFIDLQTA